MHKQNWVWKWPLYGSLCFILLDVIFYKWIVIIFGVVEIIRSYIALYELLLKILSCSYYSSGIQFYSLLVCFMELGLAFHRNGIIWFPSHSVIREIIWKCVHEKGLAASKDYASSWFMFQKTWKRIGILKSFVVSAHDIYVIIFDNNTHDFSF